MPAYLIAEHIVTDPVKFEEYRTKVGPMMAKHGARYLTKVARTNSRGRSLETGARCHHRVPAYGRT